MSGLVLPLRLKRYATWGRPRSNPYAPKIPNYDVYEQLGEGGTASVWLAQRHHADHRCVIKLLHESHESDPVTQSRFLREAQVTALLHHPGIARVYDAGRLDRRMYIAMEHISGCDLWDLAGRWSEGQVPIALCGAIALRVLDSLHYAHTYVDSEGAHLGIVHRDLSTRNIMVSFEGQIKLIDFGLVMSRLSNVVTAPGVLSGTVKYMSPEQLDGSSPDARSDLYALGAVLYELLTGQSPHPGRRFEQVLAAVALRIPPAPSKINPSLPKALDEVVLKALQKRPEDRFQSAAEFKAALEAALADVAIPSTTDIAETLCELFPEEYEEFIEIQYPNGIEDTQPFDLPSAQLLSPSLAQANIPTVASTPPCQPLPAITEVEPSSKRGILMTTMMGGLLLLFALHQAWAHSFVTAF